MKNETSWRPSKYVQSGRHWASSNDPEEVGVGSRLITDSVAKIYSKHLAACARGRLLDLGCGKAPLYGIYRGLVDSVTCSDWIDSDHVDVVSDCRGYHGGPEVVKDWVVGLDFAAREMINPLDHYV